MKRTKKTIVTSTVMAGAAVAGALLMGGNALASEPSPGSHHASGRTQVHRVAQEHNAKLHQHLKCLERHGVRVTARRTTMRGHSGKVDAKTRRAYKECGLPDPGKSGHAVHKR